MGEPKTLKLSGREDALSGTDKHNVQLYFEAEESEQLIGCEEFNLAVVIAHSPDKMIISSFPFEFINKPYYSTLSFVFTHKECKSRYKINQRI